MVCVICLCACVLWVMLSSWHVKILCAFARVCVCTYMCVCVCVHTCVCVCTYTRCTYMYVYTHYVYIHVFVHCVYICVCVCVCVCVCLYIHCVYIHVCVCVCVCVCLYIHCVYIHVCVYIHMDVHAHFLHTHPMPPDTEVAFQFWNVFSPSPDELIQAINNDIAIAKQKLSSPDMEEFKNNNFFCSQNQQDVGGSRLWWRVARTRVNGLVVVSAKWNCGQNGVQG